MTLPPSVRAGVERALSDAAVGSGLTSIEPIGGGCVSHARRVVTDHGVELFLKWNPDPDTRMFSAEAEGLAALRATEAARVPDVHGQGAGDEGSWLLLEFVRPGPFGPSEHERLAASLAALHSVRHPYFGWRADNWIGSLVQPNGPADGWGAFWRDRRLRPQLEAARRAGELTESLFDRVLAATPAALADVTTPSLVHGDLWSGNVFADERGRPVLIDPAVYAGHGEVDLAMAELFGGFGSALLDGYWARTGDPAPYLAHRRDLYQLYYLLVHVNLFGRSYTAGARSAAKRFLAAWGG